MPHILPLQHLEAAAIDIRFLSHNGALESASRKIPCSVRHEDGQDSAVRVVSEIYRFFIWHHIWQLCPPTTHSHMFHRHAVDARLPCPVVQVGAVMFIISCLPN